MKGEEGFDRTDSMLEGLGAGWTASLLAKVYPSFSRYLIKEFLQAVVEVSIVDIWSRELRERTSITAHRRSAEFAIRWTSNVNCYNKRKLGRIGESDTLPGADKGEHRRFDVKRPTDSWTKIRDLQHTLIQYLVHQTRFGTGEDETSQREEDVRRHAGGMALAY